MKLEKFVEFETPKSYRQDAYKSYAYRTADGRFYARRITSGLGHSGTWYLFKDTVTGKSWERSTLSECREQVAEFYAAEEGK